MPRHTPSPTDPPHSDTWTWMGEDWPAEVCKHGRRWRCDACGTGAERDAGHWTSGGRGVVERLRHGARKG